MREAFGVREVRGVERGLTHGSDGLDTSVEDVGRREGIRFTDHVMDS